MARPAPTNGTTTGTLEEFRSCNSFAQNFCIDRPRLWLPVAPMNVTTTDTIISAGAGTCVLTEINSSEVMGMLFNSDNDSHSWLVPIPADIDLEQAIRFRALWSNSQSVGTGSARFYFTYLELNEGTTALAVASSTMSTDGANQTDLAANVLQWSNWSTLNASTLTTVPGDDFLVVKCYVDVTTISDATLFGAQMEYYRKFIGGDR